MMTHQELKRMLDTAMGIKGEDFIIFHDGIKSTQKGYASIKNNRKFVVFYPGTEIKSGDTLIRVISGDNWFITEIESEVISGKLYALRAFYQTEYDKQNKSTHSSVYVFNDSSNIIAGDIVSATMNINIGAIETEIEEKGGLDKTELRAMINEIKNSFEKQENLPKGSLARFSELLEKHSWITGSLVQLIGSAAIQYLFMNLIH